MSSSRLPISMASDSDERAGDDPDDGPDNDNGSTGDSPDRDPISPDALDEFLDGLEEEMGASFGTVSTRAEKQDVKREIASKMGVEEEYHPNSLTAFDQHGEEGLDAHQAVEERYEELRHEGAIQEDPDCGKAFEEWNRRLDRHHKGEIDLLAGVDNSL